VRSAVRRVLLLRHGRTSWNAEDRFQGQTDVDLDEVGRRQADRAARLLAALRPHALVSSDLRRARDTAGALAALTGLDVVSDKRLRETYAGSWQGMTAGEIDAAHPEQREAWRSGRDVRPGGDGELRWEVGHRVATAVREHAAVLGPGQLLVAVSHGGAVSSGLQTLLGVPREVWPVVSGLNNCHWSLLREHGERWVLEEHNAGSLPQEVVGDEA
jgi:glucosyl-3-phosphoglycerate phosphatase